MVGGTLCVRGVGREFHPSGFPTRGRFPEAGQSVFRGGSWVKGLAGQCGGSGRDDGPGAKTPGDAHYDQTAPSPFYRFIIPPYL